MAIQSLSGKTNAPVLPSKSAPTGKVNSTEPKIAEKTSDSVAITSVAKEITKAFESSTATPGINEERVQAVKKALADGNYPIDAEKIASKMIQMEQEQFNNSR